MTSVETGLQPVVKHPGHPDQKVHGRRIPGTVDPDVAEKAIRLVGEYGGLSIKMTDGSEPESGFMVARNSKRYGTAVTVDEFYGPEGARILGEFLIRNRSELGSGRAYLGVWHQKTEKVDGVERPLPRKRQVVHLDVTDNVEGRERSIALGRRRDQISIWDVVNQDEIATGGKGAEVAKGSSDSTDPEGAVRDDGRGDHGLGREGPRPTRGERPPGHLTPVGKHGQHDQSTHGRRGHALETGAHAADATMGPASPVDGYGNARTPKPGGFFEATEQEMEDYYRGELLAALKPEIREKIEGTPQVDEYLFLWKAQSDNKARIFIGPNGCAVTVKGRINPNWDFTEADLDANLAHVGELQRISPAPGLQVIVDKKPFTRPGIPESTMGYVDTRDLDTMYLKPQAIAGRVEMANMMDVGDSKATRSTYVVTHEYGHVVDRRSDEKSLADFNEVVQSNKGLVDGSSRYAREGYFGEGVASLEVSAKPTGREMFAEAWTGWVLSQGRRAQRPGMVKFFADKYGWDSETGTAPMAKARGKGRIYFDSFGPEGGWVLDEMPGESAPRSTVVKFAPGLRPVLKHLSGQHDQATHGKGGASATAGRSVTADEFVALQDRWATENHPDIAGYGGAAELWKERVTRGLTDRLDDVSTGALVDAAAAGETKTWSEFRDLTEQAMKPGSYVIQANGSLWVADASYSSSGRTRPAEEYVDSGTPEAERMVREAAVSRMVSMWAASSNDENVVSLAVQRAAQDEFGLKEAMPWKTNETTSRAVDDAYASSGPTYRRFVRAQYDQTQQMLSDMGVSEVGLHRGIRVKDDDAVALFGAETFFVKMDDAGSQFADSPHGMRRPYGMESPDVKRGPVGQRPMSSWSTSMEQADRFTSGITLTNDERKNTTPLIMSARIPASKIIATPFTGVGCLTEQEVVTLSGDYPVEVYTIASKRSRYGDLQAEYGGMN
jgi:hypothetical protein